MKDTEEARALKIAAKIMQAAGLCRYDSPMKRRRIRTDASEAVWRRVQGGHDHE